MSNYLHPYLTPTLLKSIVDHGLRKVTNPKKVIVVGAGMSGLVSASLLKQAGHNVTVIESRERVGGRVYTMRHPFMNGQYVEAGAMRIPNTHYLTLSYIKKFGLKVNPFVNATPNDLIFVNDRKARFHQYNQNPDFLGYPVLAHEKGKTAATLIQVAIQPIVDFVNKNPLRNWPIVIREFEKYSLSTFLRHNPLGHSLSPGAIEKVYVFSGVEGLPELSLLEIIREFIILLNNNIKFYEIIGGNDQLPQAFVPDLKQNLRFSQKMTKIRQNDSSVTIQTVHTKTLEHHSYQADVTIVTLPLGLMQFIEVEPRNSLSHYKWRAIRELHSVPSTKIGLQFKHRFWEKHGHFGGQMVTDLPIRNAYFPSHDFGSETGVLLGSYTWEDDAMVWVSMSKERRLQYALKNLAKIYGEEILHEYVAGAVHSWGADPYAAGAYTMFKPNQESELFPHLATPEGRLHFAGEHTSVPHGWIQGAIESGIRAAIEVNERK
ncbi:flavin monoamine oxidase family protein [Pseudalkalibacillus berkeleyi]|uniref:Flavin monoamine oxidase family protein n=1 Tax=Pseudalkalibacillus berkeleyi TaxID=1069813 RepID=A0ABS9GY27_9BACL|nr:flavin monoamine oxidase family protein [Pseudalkalibacillus berkeleyi]MCF6136605.1 flavin monoamine oxidase family protein [Pseudalkalibacillus berkeleyi]